uniref:Uncharacterized protein n=1 Tax=Ditylenchus dipsaci TaxID=166011 RepID=A0A915DXC5_9BILA
MCKDRRIGWCRTGLFTFIVALFVDEALAIYLDAFFTVIIYGCLILIYRSKNHRWYLLFMGLNGTLIVFKFFYLLILTIIFIVRPTSYGSFPRQFSTYGSSSASAGLPSSSESINDKSSLLGDIGGVLGTVDFKHDIGDTNSITDTISGVLGTVKLGSSHRSTYDPMLLQYGRPGGIMEVSQMSTAMKLILITISLLFNCFTQFIAFSAFAFLKNNSFYTHQTHTAQHRENFRETPSLKSAIREKTVSPLPKATPTHYPNGVDVRTASAASRYSINTDV